jgi:GNAT superfamily N-acetyltransferase
MATEDRIVLDVSRATPDEAEDAAAILTAAARWLEAHGKWNDWPIPYPVSRVRETAERGILYLAKDFATGRPVGTLTLQWEDVAFWGERPPEAGYVHRVAVSPELMGRGLGQAMMDWAADEVARHGRSLVRLDCPFENTDLRRYYESIGFVFKGAQQGRGSYRAALYERAV